MATNPANIEASSTRVAARGDDLGAQAGKSQHVSDSVATDLRSLTPAELTAVFDSMSTAATLKPSNLPDLKITDDAAGALKSEGKSESTNDPKREAKQDAKPPARHEISDLKSKRAGEKHQSLKKGKHLESHTGRPQIKETVGSTNYILREQDEAHPGQIVERTYDKSGKLIPDAPVKVVGTNIK